MRNIEIIKNRYLKDDLPVRLGGIAANLARIASCSLNPVNCDAVVSMLEESKFFIEWTAPDTPLEVRAFLVELQIQLAFWQLVWPRVCHEPKEREELARLTALWSQMLLMLRGKLTVATKQNPLF
jgi:hypothetical protein